MHLKLSLAVISAIVLGYTSAVPKHYKVAGRSLSESKPSFVPAINGDADYSLDARALPASGDLIPAKRGDANYERDLPVSDGFLPAINGDEDYELDE